MAFLAPAIATGLAGAAGSSILSLLGFEDGGKVKKDGMYMLHKGEIVVPSSTVNKSAKPTKVRVNKKTGKATQVKKTTTGRGGKKGGRGNRGK